MDMEQAALLLRALFPCPRSNVCIHCVLRPPFSSFTSLSSILFVGTELTPQFHFTPHDCYLWQVWQGVSAMTVMTAVDIILIVRGTLRSFC
jgi:hypothetical protein